MTAGQNQPDKANHSYKNGKDIYQNAGELIQSLFPLVDGQPRLSDKECQLIITSLSIALDIPKIQLCKKISEYSINRKIRKHGTHKRLMMLRLKKILPDIDFE